MWLQETVFCEDLENICKAQYIDWDELNGKTVFITGSTGLIGYYVTSALLYRNLKYNANIKVLALVRNLEAASKKFSEQLKENIGLCFIEGSVERLPHVEENIDFIIHGASPTSSKMFLEQPVKVIDTLIFGTTNVLELAREKQVESFIFLSSMEVYGSNNTEEKIDEKHESFLDTMSPRNSYPEGKRLCENLCASYMAQYNVPVKVLRLTQSFGPGVKKDDGRVFAQFLRAAMAGEDIVLLSKGTTKRCYLYLADAVTAILTVLLSGENGAAYNAANEDTYCSILDMAKLVAKEICHDAVQVVIREDSNAAKKYMPEMFINLDTTKLKKLGWQSTTGLSDMYKRMSLFYK